jgi:hypothetical protein
LTFVCILFHFLKSIKWTFYMLFFNIIVIKSKNISILIIVINNIWKFNTLFFIYVEEDDEMFIELCFHPSQWFVNSLSKMPHGSKKIQPNCHMEDNPIQGNMNIWSHNWIKLICNFETIYLSLKWNVGTRFGWSLIVVTNNHVGNGQNDTSKLIGWFFWHLSKWDPFSLNFLIKITCFYNV